jgi:hypothetical protein
VHGCWDDLNATISKAIRQHPDITHIVQVGDFAYGWPGSKPFKASRGYFSDEEMTIYNDADKMWLDGNHENFDLLEYDLGEWQPGWKYMPRGSLLEIDTFRMLFFGGASSIDKPMRTPHKSWWPQELITCGEINRTIEKTSGPIDAIFSHEHPLSIPYAETRYNDKLFGISDKRLLEELKEYYKPDFWFFGHHHKRDQGKIDNTEWMCCPIIESREYTIWTGTSVFTQ